MKRFLKLSLFAVIFFSMIVPVAAEENNIVNRFDQLQNEITQLLVPNADFTEFIYDHDTISNLIDKFDFESLSQETGLDITSESFKQQALSNIDESVPIVDDYIEPIYITGKICNVNATENRWNSEREFSSKSRADKEIIEGRNTVLLVEKVGYVAAGGITSGGGFVVAGMLAGVTGVTTWYVSGYLNWLEHHNKKSGCGVVSDVNRFTLTYKIWNQTEHV